VAIRRVAEVADDFHARFSALTRSYRYTVLPDRWPSPLRERFLYRVNEQLDVVAMNESCATLHGVHDFRAFGRSPRASQSGEQHSCVRLMLAASCRTNAESALISFDFTANGFLTGMVRRLVGTLLLVGKGQLDVEGFAQILASRNEAHPGAAVPPCGLCLIQVTYPPGMVVWSEY
jgi:tRNA pseudouridine38-40 synthase